MPYPTARVSAAWSESYLAVRASRSIRRTDPTARSRRRVTTGSSVYATFQHRAGAKRACVPMGDQMDRIYKGRQESDAVVLFTEDAQHLARQGYAPVSRTWIPGAWTWRAYLLPLGIGASLVWMMMAADDGLRSGRVTPAQAGSNILPIALLAIVGVILWGVVYSLVKPDGTLLVAYRQSAPDLVRPPVVPAAPDVASPSVGALLTTSVGPTLEQLPPAAEPAPSAASTKKCPDCAEAIRADARICRFCRYEFWRQGSEPVAVPPPTVEPLVPTQAPSEPDAARTPDSPVVPEGAEVAAHSGESIPSGEVLMIAVIGVVLAIVAFAIVKG